VEAIFAALFCFVFTASQTFALKAASLPVGTNILGSYAGVMQGVFDPRIPDRSNTSEFLAFNANVCDAVKTKQKRAAKIAFTIRKLANRG